MAYDEYREFYITKSHLTSYKFCPLQYRKSYVEKIQEERTNYALAIGLRFHDFADKFFDVCMDYPPEKWFDFIHDDYNVDETDYLIYFIQNEINRYNLLNDKSLFLPFAKELKVTVDVEGFDDPIKGIGGTIDRIDALENGTYRLVEYKTGGSFYKQSMQFELGYYVYLLSQHKDYKHMKFSYGTVINPRLGICESVNPSYISTIIKAIEQLKHARIHDIFEPQCTSAKYSACELCNSLEEANLFQPPVEFSAEA